MKTGFSCVRLYEFSVYSFLSVDFRIIYDPEKGELVLAGKSVSRGDGKSGDCPVLAPPKIFPDGIRAAGTYGKLNPLKVGSDFLRRVQIRENEKRGLRLVQPFHERSDPFGIVEMYSAVIGADCSHFSSLKYLI
jgi:hypothetical protein